MAEIINGNNEKLAIEYRKNEDNSISLMIDRITIYTFENMKKLKEFLDYGNGFFEENYVKLPNSILKAFEERNEKENAGPENQV